MVSPNRPSAGGAQLIGAGCPPAKRTVENTTHIKKKHWKETAKRMLLEKLNCGTVWRWFRIFEVFYSQVLWINNAILYLYSPQDQLLSDMDQSHKPPKVPQQTQRLFQGIHNPPRKRIMQQRLVSHMNSLAVALNGACQRHPRFEDFEECLDK